MRNIILARQTSESKPTHWLKLVEKADLVVGGVAGWKVVQLGPGGSETETPRSGAPDKTPNEWRNYQIESSKLPNKCKNYDYVDVDVYINSIAPTLSFRLNYTENVPSIAIQSTILNQDNIHKNIKFRIKCGEYKFISALIFFPCNLCNEFFEDYIIIIPVCFIDETQKYSIKYSNYKFMFNQDKTTIDCPKVTINNKTKIYKPDYILPRRIYPIWVYFFAIYLYKIKKISQKQVAEEIRQKFGYAKFNSSTVSRIVNSVYEDIKNHKFFNNINFSQLNPLKNSIKLNTEINNICLMKKIIVMKKIDTINAFCNLINNDLFSITVLNNIKKFVNTWFKTFKKHFLIPKVYFKLYVMP